MNGSDGTRLGRQVSLTYDINEDLRFSISNDLTYLRLKSIPVFFGRRISRIFGAALTKTMKPPKRHGRDRIEIDFTLIQNHNPYRYREAGAFAYLNVTRDDYHQRSTPSTKRSTFGLSGTDF